MLHQLKAANCATNQSTERRNCKVSGATFFPNLVPPRSDLSGVAGSTLVLTITTPPILTGHSTIPIVPATWRHRSNRRTHRADTSISLRIAKNGESTSKQLIGQRTSASSRTNPVHTSELLSLVNRHTTLRPTLAPTSHTLGSSPWLDDRAFTSTSHRRAAVLAFRLIRVFNGLHRVGEY